MPTQTLKNKSTNKRIFLFKGSPVPITLQKNLKSGLTYKLPVNLLEPKEVLKAKLKNRGNTIKKVNNMRKKDAEERKQRLESQARFAAMLREAREKNAAASSASPFLLKAFENNNSWATKTIKRGPGVRGIGVINGSSPKPLMPSNLYAMLASKSANSTVRKANLLRMSKAALKAAPAPASAPRKPLGKFWKKEGTNSNSNSD